MRRNLLQLAGIAVWLAAPTTARAEDPPTVLVNELRGIDISPGETSQISGLVRSAVVETGRYTVVSRDQMDAVTEEMVFQKGDQCDSTRCQAEIGGALGATKMIAGSVGKLGRAYVLNLRIIDIGTVVEQKAVAEQCVCEIHELSPVVERAVERLLVEGRGTQRRASAVAAAPAPAAPVPVAAAAPAPAAAPSAPSRPLVLAPEPTPDALAVTLVKPAGPPPAPSPAPAAAVARVEAPPAAIAVPEAEADAVTDEDDSSVFGRWWFWTGVVGAAAAGTAAALAMQSSDSKQVLTVDAGLPRAQ